MLSLTNLSTHFYGIVWAYFCAILVASVSDEQPLRHNTTSNWRGGYLEVVHKNEAWRRIDDSATIYKYFDYRTTHAEAQKLCEQFDGELAAATDFSHYDAIKELIPSYGTEKKWFAWIRHAEAGNCVVISSELNFQATKCVDWYGFVCAYHFKKPISKKLPTIVTSAKELTTTTAAFLDRDDFSGTSLIPSDIAAQKKTAEGNAVDFMAKRSQDFVQLPDDEYAEIFKPKIKNYYGKVGEKISEARQFLHSNLNGGDALHISTTTDYINLPIKEYSNSSTEKYVIFSTMGYSNLSTENNDYLQQSDDALINNTDTNTFTKTTSKTTTIDESNVYGNEILPYEVYKQHWFGALTVNPDSFDNKKYGAENVTVANHNDINNEILPYEIYKKQNRNVTRRNVNESMKAFNDTTLFTVYAAPNTTVTVPKIEKFVEDNNDEKRQEQQNHTPDEFVRQESIKQNVFNFYDTYDNQTRAAHMVIVYNVMLPPSYSGIFLLYVLTGLSLLLTIIALCFMVFARRNSRVYSPTLV